MSSWITRKKLIQIELFILLIWFSPILQFSAGVILNQKSTFVTESSQNLHSTFEQKFILMKSWLNYQVSASSGKLRVVDNYVKRNRIEKFYNPEK